MMRRRSERKKSTDVSSPAPASRRTIRRSRKTSETASEKSAHPEMSPTGDEAEKDTPSADCPVEPTNEESSAEPGRNRSRNRTPVKDRSSPAKRKAQNTIADLKIEAIPEENSSIKEDSPNESKPGADVTASNEQAPKSDIDAQAASCSSSPKTNVDIMKPLDVLEIQAEEQDEEKLQSQDASTKNENMVENVDSSNKNEEEKSNNDEIINKGFEAGSSDATDDLKNNKTDSQSPKCEVTNSDEKTDAAKANKRTWITKRTVQNRSPLLVITTETLKRPEGVHPAPKLNLGSPEIQEVNSEREEGEQTPSPERETHKINTINSTEKLNRNPIELSSAPKTINKINIKVEKQSPTSKKPSNVLFITNLVRPFTVLQLKGLLARTGKMVEEGFWIDRIKSKCYVQYETEDEAVETRHALHGVRWPVSNPKCLIVEFARKSDLDRAIQSTKEEQSNFGQESHRDNVLIGMGWNRDRNGIDEKRTIRPVREWDVGKKESLDRDKNREILRRRSREREIFFGNRETDRNGKDRRPRSKGRGEARSSSRSPVRKVKKKENDPPLRLLDDLFRKTKSTPCIYWLPLTPEQIAEKEAFRQKRLEEHKLRVKQRELEKGKEREKERNRTNERRDRERERDQRRNRSSDRRSRSRDRRRY
ncbi:PREDICTED: apoptotic chromatin condensation inducer in the nucleus isoform X2 [Rhagoletis zephyria]|uniref:apoptotic chromatin condensation inducer in the nucleus isoform X2 n=1 Tax=Rhagoletis zephyria TaxID=28612 RepID=UPI0008112525|nr:PREDICTED: apoptotic chromatin condensation inducer in the nucleus isoform X2 [Rhagoletis zephyria]XP_036320989.1 apoptotic chromatin condensation inducer in the nucleus isoform X2 [Rhagoletis pomonella]